VLSVRSQVAVGHAYDLDVSTSEWFRSSRWDVEARQEFESRLARSRDSNRAQYLRIKALAIESAEPRAAEELWQRIIRDYSENYEAAFAQERLGDLYRQRGDIDLAETAYRRVLALGGGTSPSGTSGSVNLSLIELLLDIPGREQDVLVQLKVVSPPSNLLHFDSDRFRWEVSLAIVSDRLGDTETSKKAAQRALALLSAPDRFSHHPGVGRAQASPALVKQLQRLSS